MPQPLVLLGLEGCSISIGPLLSLVLNNGPTDFETAETIDMTTFEGCWMDKVTLDF